ncbi:unnamed protein product [Schistosoma curassoni]|nr:unnamed protein product [Schistosoma curassoni]
MIGTEIINFLGHITDAQCIQSLRNKPKATLIFSHTTIDKYLRTLNGLVSFYRRFTSNCTSPIRHSTDQPYENTKIVDLNDNATKAIYTV